MRLRSRVTSLLPPYPVPIPIRHARQYYCYAMLNSELGIPFGQREPHVGQWIMDTIQDGDIFYDIGAHIGYYSYLAAAAGAAGGVLVEPNPGPGRRASKSLHRNNLQNDFKLVTAAATETCGVTRFDTGDNTVTGSVSESGELYVTTTTLDELYRINGVGPSVIKVDVEGGAGRVLAGAESVRELHPVWIIEIHDDDEANEVSETLSGDGYDLHWLDDDHLIAEDAA